MTPQETFEADALLAELGIDLETATEEQLAELEAVLASLTL